MTADERFDRIEHLIENLAQRNEERFASIDERFASIEERFDRIDARFDRMDQRFDRIDHSIENLTQRVTHVEESLDNLTRYVLEFRQETLNRFQAIETRLDIPMSIATSMESKLPPLSKAIADYGTLSTQIVAQQWKQTDNTFDLARRVLKLEEIVSKLHPAA
jgi:chromosome segregation ATPase